MREPAGSRCTMTSSGKCGVEMKVSTRLSYLSAVHSWLVAVSLGEYMDAVSWSALESSRDVKSYSDKTP
jgi:hypothetical protein